VRNDVHPGDSCQWRYPRLKLVHRIDARYVARTAVADERPAIPSVSSIQAVAAQREDTGSENGSYPRGHGLYPRARSARSGV
jgi:hypothetical protein